MMVAESAENNRWQPREALSPALRYAVMCILNDPLPEELRLRALAAVRCQVARFRRKPRRRIMSWSMPAIAASIVLIVLGAYAWAARTDGGRSGRSPVLAATGAEVAAAFSDDSPTAWTFSKAANKSPEAFYALLDRRAHQSSSASSPLFASTSVTPSFSVHGGTAQ